jgi:hypothetical protein
MPEKIDPALVQLTKENPLHGFQQGDDVVVWTSTCTDMPALIPISGEKDTTARLYASIAARYKNAFSREHVSSSEGKISVSHRSLRQRRQHDQNRAFAI